MYFIEFHFRQLVIILSLDGRAYATLKNNRGTSDMISLTGTLFDYVSGNERICRAIIPDYVELSQGIEDATSLTGLKNIRQLGLFLSTKRKLLNWLLFNFYLI